MTVFTATVIIQNYTLTSKQSNKHILIVVKMSSNKNMEFIAYIWKPGMKTAMLSKEDESFDKFKARVYSCYPYQMGYMVQFSEFKEIF